MWRFGIFGFVILVATAAWAHDGVKNRDVMARMNGMSALADQTKVLAMMARGRIEFNATEARRAAKAMAHESARIPVLFKAPATDPKSEADPAIWLEPQDFNDRAAILTSAAKKAEKIRTQRDLARAMKDIGSACKSCHGDYRQ